MQRRDAAAIISYYKVDLTAALTKPKREPSSILKRINCIREQIGQHLKDFFYMHLGCELHGNLLHQMDLACVN